MQKFFNLSLKVGLLAIALAFIACQNEEPFETDIDSELTLSAESPIIEMMKRTSSSDGSYDNIVDGASCLGIQFPYDITVNGLELTIETMEDLQRIEEIFDAAEVTAEMDDANGVNGTDEANQVENNILIAYPITVTTADYTEIVIQSDEALKEHANQCVENGDDDDIECADIVYPVNLFTYNPNFQQTGNVTVNHDMELRRFLAGLEDADLISIEFPLSFEMFDGSEVSVNNNTELADAMERASETCYEDDNDDYNDDDFTKASLDSLLVTCPWLVKKVKRTDVDSSQQYVDSTEQYQDYLLVFTEDGKVINDDGFSPMSEGEWYVEVSDFKVYLSMEFKDAEIFNGSMYTYEIGEGTIKLDGGEEDAIILEQSCGYENQTCSEAFIEETLASDCRWSITDGQGNFIEELDIDFSIGNMLVYDPNDTLSDEGSWDISGTTISFNDLSTSLADYTGDWEVIACSEKRFRLQRDDQILVLVENCDDSN